MKFIKENKEILALKQIMDATWILKFKIPSDKINKTRKTVGEKPEILVLEHKRNDNYYMSTELRFKLIEDDERIAKKAVFWIEGNKEKEEKYEIRNKKNIFEYMEVDKK